MELRVLAPDAEEGVPTELEPERLAPHHTEVAVRRVGEDRDRDHRRHREREGERGAPAAAREQRRQREWGELRGRAEPDQDPPPDGRAEGDQRGDHEQRHQPVVRVRDEREEGERAGRPGEREHQPQPAIPEARAKDEQTEHRQHVERDRGGVRGREVAVHEVLERPDELERQVGEVGDRPIRVQVRVVGHIQRPSLVDAGRAEHRRVADVPHPADQQVGGDPPEDQCREPDHENTVAGPGAEGRTGAVRAAEAVAEGTIEAPPAGTEGDAEKAEEAKS